MRPGTALGASYCDEADLELFELQPTTVTETYRAAVNIPEMCKFSFCEACRQVMPPRSEHCIFCKKCVLRVDHHCIWMGNACVGLLNHKFFILYLIYLTLGCLLLSIFWIKVVFFTKGTGFLTLLSESKSEAGCYLLAFTLTIAMSIMTAFQITLMMNNKTTFELNLSPTKTPFKHDHPVKNIQMVFGMSKKHWFSPFHHPFPNMKLSGMGGSGSKA